MIHSISFQQFIELPGCQTPAGTLIAADRR